MTLDRAAVDAWGWRIPFLLGIAAGLAGLYIRRHLIEDEAARPVVASPVPEAFRTAWRTIVEFVGLNAVNAVGFYFCFIYVTTY
jgi:MHS family proline/betaine transporter-like MFS transporter